MIVNSYLVKILVLFFVVYSFEVNSNIYEKKKFICADEIGPVIEFSVPVFEKDQDEKNISFKFFYSDDRNLFHNENGAIFKKSSPIDSSYFYYKMDTILKNEKSINLVFEFFPPSTMMLKKDQFMFKTLACWKN
jgi:hypothetical protein